MGFKELSTSLVFFKMIENITFGQNINVASLGLNLWSEVSFACQHRKFEICDTHHLHFCCHSFYYKIPYCFQTNLILCSSSLISQSVIKIFCFWELTLKDSQKCRHLAQWCFLRLWLNFFVDVNLLLKGSLKFQIYIEVC